MTTSRVIHQTLFYILISLLFLSCSSSSFDVKVDASFLANWMGKSLPIIENQTLLDLSLPGTHDTLTYDLSERVADNANDMYVSLNPLSLSLSYPLSTYHQHTLICLHIHIT